MNQQINLHQPIFRKQRALFSARIVLRIAGIWALGLGVVYGLGLLNERSLMAERQRLETTRSTASARLQNMTQLAAAKPARSQLLGDELARLQSEQIQKEAVLQLLSRGELGSTRGFGPQIDALAGRRLAGVWLTHIALREGGRDVSLEGEAVEAALLPQYVQHLAGAAGFPGARFSDVRLHSPDGSGDGVLFELHTSPGKDLP